MENTDSRGPSVSKIRWFEMSEQELQAFLIDYPEGFNSKWNENVIAIWLHILPLALGGALHHTAISCAEGAVEMYNAASLLITIVSQARHMPQPAKG